MPISKSFNNTTYSIPLEDEFNWASLSDYLVALADNTQTINKQKVGIRVATTSPVTVLATTDYCIVTDLSVAGAVAVNLPAGVTGQVFVIVDGKGDAQTNNITITPAAGNINGAATYVIAGNREGVTLAYDGTEWKVIAEHISSITNEDVSASAAIAYSKLNLATSIVNADISGSAAIDGSKIVSASGSVSGVVTTGTQTLAGAKTFSGTINVGSDITTGISAPNLHVSGTGATNVQISRVAATVNAPILFFAKGRGTAATPTVSSSGDEILRISAYSHDGTNFVEACRINSVVDGTPGTTDMPGRIGFLTSQDGSATPVEAFRIDSKQNVIIMGSTVSPTSIGHEERGLVLRSNDSTLSNGDYFPSIRWESVDNNLTTTNPKTTAWISAKASEGFGADTSSGTQIEFATSPAAGGVSVTPTVNMVLESDGFLSLTQGIKLTDGGTLTILDPDTTVSTDELIGSILIKSSDASNTSLVGARFSAYSKDGIGSDTGYRISAAIAGTETTLAESDASGLNIFYNGDTTGGTVFAFNSAATASQTSYCYGAQYVVDADCTGGYFFRMYNSSGTTIGRIEAASNTTVAYQTSSDERIKQNPTAFEALPLVLQMIPKEFEFKSNPGIRHKGFYAQELHQVCPEVVSVGNDEVTSDGSLSMPWAVDYGKITPILVKAIQEQQTVIEQLKARLDALEAN